MSDYTYDAIVRNVYDGDTLTVDIDCGFDIWFKNLKIRLYGINAPELNTAEGKKAKKFLTDLLHTGDQITVITIKDKKEKYGRYLAKIIVSDKDVNQLIIESGNAKPYFGKGQK